jgi:hypothetical protein
MISTFDHQTAVLADHMIYMISALSRGIGISIATAVYDLCLRKIVEAGAVRAEAPLTAYKAVSSIWLVMEVTALGLSLWGFWSVGRHRSKAI